MVPSLKTYASKEDILKGLNPEQKKAVTHGQGPLLVIAGAGTGKTTVITRRIAYLINTKLAKPSEILALTFTDKAAAEMESRVDQLVPYGYIDVTISTFHSFGDKLLRDHAIELGLNPDYRVLSLAEQLVFLREHLFELPLKYYRSLGNPTKHLEALLRVISRAQDEDVSPEEYLKWASKTKQKEQLEVAKVYKKYQELKAAKGFVDFADQVSLPLKLLKRKPAVLKMLQGKYKYILIDEFQDTNYAQFEFASLLAGPAGKIMVSGDDDQAIYRFRGAAISNILNFEKVYKLCKKVVLQKNYRSTQIILDTAYRLIKHNNPDRLEFKAGVDKQLVSMRNSGNRDVQSQVSSQKPVEHFHFDRVESEADWGAETIKKKHEQGTNYSDFAILVRANAETEEYKLALNMHKIPYQLFGGAGLYNFDEVNLVLNFLRSIGDLADSMSLNQLAVSPIYQLDGRDLQKINSFAKRRNYTLYHVFSHLEDGVNEFAVLDDLKSESRATVKSLVNDIDYYLEFAKHRTTGEVLYQFLKKSGYLAKLYNGGEKNDSQLKNLGSFFEQVRSFNSVAEVDRVSEFVKHINLMKEARDNPESLLVDQEIDAINLLTVHKAKGLEFKIAFLVSLVTDKFPIRSRKDQIALPDELLKEKLPGEDHNVQEERRLFYVGMTRAKDELFLTSSADYGGKRRRKISRFVLEAVDLPKTDIKLYKKTTREQIELFAPAEIIEPRIKKIAKDGTLSLSFYHIDDYLTCPLKYKYVHILRVPLLPNHQIIYGQALHQAVQTYDLARLNKQSFSQSDLLASLKDNWSSEGFISREHEEQRFKAAQASLKRFYKKEQKSNRQIKHVEESFSIRKEDLIIRGRWDRVDEQDGNIYIVDFKSSEVKDQKKADKKAKESLQLAIYAWSWLAKEKKLPYRVELNFLESGLVGSVQKDVKEIDKAWGMIRSVADGLKNNIFTAKPNSVKCSYCAYKEICPAAAI